MGAEAGKDIRELMARYPEKSMQIGYGDGRQLGYPLTYLRPWLAFSGHPVTVSGPSTIERAFAGKPFPTLKINWIEACKTDFWLIDPKGKPFALDSFIADGRAFPKEVELSFQRHYQKNSFTATIRYGPARPDQKIHSFRHMISFALLDNYILHSTLEMITCSHHSSTRLIKD